jgi:hypothetical protein
MKALHLGLLVCLTLISINVNATPVTQIKFAKGASGATWNGIIKDGNKKFKLFLGKGQTLKVSSDDVYTWTAIAPNGKELGCDGGSYCAPDGEIFPLPSFGAYIISTDYRMSSCADCPTDKTRKVTVYFEAR